MPLVDKYRPRVFSEFYGNSAVIERVKKILIQKDIPHAFLIVGDYGIGKTSLARLMARALNCDKFAEKLEICLECDNCKKMNKMTYDILEIDAATNRGIQEIRRVKDFLIAHPFELRRKVLILDETQQLTSEAVSALLKIVEEPPEFSFIIMVTTNQEQIIKSLLSRLFVIKLERPTSQVLRNFLRDICSKEQMNEPVLPEGVATFRDILNWLEGSNISFINISLEQFLLLWKQGELQKIINFVQEQPIPFEFLIFVINNLIERISKINSGNNLLFLSGLINIVSLMQHLPNTAFNRVFLVRSIFMIEQLLNQYLKK